MKKSVLWLLGFCIPMMLLGCGKQIDELATQPTPSVEVLERDESVLPVENETDVTTIPLKSQPDQTVTVRLSSVESKYYDPEFNKRVIFTYTCEYPVVDVLGNEEASKRINDILGMENNKYNPNAEGGSLAMDEITYLDSLAEDYYSVNGDIDFEFRFDRSCQIIQADDIISIEFINKTRNLFLPDETIDTLVYSFDAKTGQELTEAHTDRGSLYSGTGTVQVSKIVESDNGKDVIDLVTVAEDGKDLLLHVSGTIYDVTISNVLSTVWYRNCVSDASIQIRAVISEEVPDLEILYTNGEGELQDYFVLEDSNGELILSDIHSIAALG